MPLFNSYVPEYVSPLSTFKNSQHFPRLLFFSNSVSENQFDPLTQWHWDPIWSEHNTSTYFWPWFESQHNRVNSYSVGELCHNIHQANNKGHCVVVVSSNLSEFKLGELRRESVSKTQETFEKQHLSTYWIDRTNSVFEIRTTTMIIRAIKVWCWKILWFVPQIPIAQLAIFFVFVIWIRAEFSKNWKSETIVAKLSILPVFKEFWPKTV